MTARGPARRVGISEQDAFGIWLRTGLRVAIEPEPLETKFNPNHDPSNGQFTSGDGGTSRYAEKNHAVKLMPLNAKDALTYQKIKNTPAVVRAMDDAWRQSADGHERGFFIYRDDDRYYPGETVRGTTGSLPDLWGKLEKPNPLEGQFGVPVAWYHTHPGDYPGVEEGDTDDRHFNESIPYHVFMIIRSHDDVKVGR